MDPLGRWLLAAALTISTPVAASAQERIPAADGWSFQDEVPAAVQAEARDASRMEGDPLRSLALPGWGQLRKGQRRGWAYLAVEAVGWIVFAERTMAGGDLRDDYRELAWTAARFQSGARRDGDFAYYEFMSKWARSGAFDAHTDLPGIQPETDPSSFNGSIWALARDIYIPPGTSPSEADPRYQQALAYYLSRAYPTGFLWDWSQAPGAQSDFVALIHESDSRFRQATTALGAIIANHLISAADAYLSGGATPRERPLAVWAEPHAGGTRLSAAFRIGVP